MFDLIAGAASLFGLSGAEEKCQSQIQVELDAQRLRNQARIEQIKLEMGTKYILHPSHNKTRLDIPRPV